MRVMGRPPRFEIVDELTVRYSWDDPNPGFLSQLASAAPPRLPRMTAMAASGVKALASTINDTSGCPCCASSMNAFFRASPLQLELQCRKRKLYLPMVAGRLRIVILNRPKIRQLTAPYILTIRRHAS